MIDFDLNQVQIKLMESKLIELRKNAIPFAVRNTINQLAIQSRREAVETIRDEMILRNKYTVNRVQFEMTRERIPERMESRMGTDLEYMELQEEGGTITKGDNAHGVVLPTSVAANQGRQKPRTRVPTRRNRIGQIELRKRPRVPKNRKQAMLFKVQDAVTSGERYFYHDTGRRRGIFRVFGGRKKFKRGWPTGARLEMIHDLSHDSVNIPKRPWHVPAVKKVSKDFEEIHIKSLNFQLKRMRK